MNVLKIPFILLDCAKEIVLNSLRTAIMFIPVIAIAAALLAWWFIVPGIAVERMGSNNAFLAALAIDNAIIVMGLFLGSDTVQKRFSENFKPDDSLGWVIAVVAGVIAGPNFFWTAVLCFFDAVFMKLLNLPAFFQ